MKKILCLCGMLATVSVCRAQTDWLQRADSLASLFQYPEAISAYGLADDSFEKYNGLVTAENMIGLDHLAAGNRDSAEIHFETAIATAERMAALFADSADSQFNLAAAYGNLALIKGAKSKVRLGRRVEEYALAAIVIDSTHSDALSVLGVFYREVAQLKWFEKLVAKTLFGGLPSGSLEKSEEYLRKAVQADRESPFAAFELGRTLLALDRPRAARSEFERLLTLSPRVSEHRRFMAEAREWLGASD